MTSARALAAGALLMLPVWSAAADESRQPVSPPPSSSSPSAAQPGSGSPLYVPPVRERPRRRVGGGVRGPEAQWPKLQALVPHHTGLTASASPPLFWWLESLPPAGTGLVFYLVDDSTGETRLRAPLQRPPAPGAQSVRLADRGIELRQGVEYEWSVALEREADGEQLAVATGWIERVDAPASAGPPTGVEAVERLARAGLWYDALASASDLIRAQPGDAAPRRARAGLLDQVGLSQASDR